MRAVIIAVIISVLAVSAIAQPHEPPAEKPKPEHERERLGLRAGYVGTTSDLRHTFGGGFNLALHWIQHIRSPLYADFTLGAFYLGKTDRNDITLGLLQQNFDRTSMRIIRFTLAPTFEYPMAERSSAYFSAGVGLYVVSLLLDEAFLEYDMTDNHFGINLAGGLTHAITQNWLVEAHAEVHKVWTSTSGDDIFFVYSEGDQDPLFFQVNVGVMLRLF